MRGHAGRHRRASPKDAELLLKEVFTRGSLWVRVCARSTSLTLRALMAHRFSGALGTGAGVFPYTRTEHGLRVFSLSLRGM